MEARAGKHGGSPKGTGQLYVVATPIGNLEDITLRALKALAGADVIAAEDTRTTARLLKHHRLQGRLIAVHEHNERRAADGIIGQLAQGKTVALVSDAGTPAISDPGAAIVARVRDAGFKVTPIPGANAAIAALSVAGIPDVPFLFVGFLPPKPAARRKALEGLRALPFTLVFHEAPHRIVECVEDLAVALGGERTLVIARELTKLFEEIHRCRLDEAAAWLRQDENRQRGEFVLIVEGAAQRAGSEGADAERILGLLLAELPLAQAVGLACAITGSKKNPTYAHALELAKEKKR
ncbi:MAG: 16S rRNA (cytidine(1402)-2'-O)-methyltransferase [Burkholderiales bacterium]